MDDEKEKFEEFAKLEFARALMEIREQGTALIIAKKLKAADLIEVLTGILDGLYKSNKKGIGLLKDLTKK